MVSELAARINSLALLKMFYPNTCGDGEFIIVTVTGEQTKGTNVCESKGLVPSVLNNDQVEQLANILVSEFIKDVVFLRKENNSVIEYLLERGATQATFRQKHTEKGSLGKNG